MHYGCNKSSPELLWLACVPCSDDDSEAELMHTYPASAHHSQPSPYGLAPQGQALQFGQFPLQGAAGWQCNGATHPAAAQPWQANNLHPGGGQMWHKQAAHTATQQMRLPVSWGPDLWHTHAFLSTTHACSDVAVPLVASGAL